MLRKVFDIYGMPVFLSLSYCLGLGFWDYLYELKNIPIFFIVFFLNIFFFIFIKQCRNSALKSLLIFLCLGLVVYISSATGFLQGHMSLGIIASILQTDQNEALEFISVIHYKYWVYGIFLFLLTLYYFLVQPLKYEIKLNNFPIIILLVFNIFNIFLAQTVAATVKYKKEEKLLTENNAEVADWKITAVKPKYDNQIVIIGESVQRDYLSLYGFEQKTTPFLDQAPVQIVSHYISAAPNTATSLVRTLAYVDSNKEIEITKNVVTLAKQAKYNTIWISNQGFLGKNDTAVSKIAIHADHKFFLKSGNYRSNNIDDEKLLTFLDEQLNKYKSRKNVIFIHMMGSHPNACERLFEQKRLYPNQSEGINCYLSSLNKLDSFIQKVYARLQQTDRSFNINYFSDHGMTIDKNGYYVDNKNKQNYDVPFFILNSDQVKQQEINKTVSAYDYLNIYAAQLGIRSPYISSQRSLERIPNNTKAMVFNWEEYIPYQALN